MANSNQQTATGSAGPKSFAVTARESLESIVVAFALAFIFRAFIVEAFVIPTGSMAPTLYGQQVTHTCSTCGFEYAHGVDQIQPGSRAYDLVLKCPNCGSTADQIPAAEMARPSSGDRILVHKWPFSVGGPLGPKRWDVTVFKDPHNGTVNYIKRLVGKPGEILEIIHGDVYVASLEEVRQKDAALVDEMDRLRRDLYQYAHGSLALTREQAAARYSAINQRLLPFLKIQRKAIDAPEAQQSLWFNVYNRDFLPNYTTKGQPDTRVGWSPLVLSISSLEAGQLESGRIPEDLRRALGQVQIRLAENATASPVKPGAEWKVAASSGELLIAKEEDRLSVYDVAARAAWDTSHAEILFNSDSERPLNIRFTGKLVDDFYGYNFAPGNGPLQRRVPVGDLRLGFTWFPEAGNGGIILEMNRHKDRFTARIQMDGTAEVYYRKGDSEKPILIGQAKLDPFRYGRAVPVEFTNVDFRVSLAVGGQEVIASKDEQFSPSLPELLARDGENPEETLPSRVQIGGYQMRFRIDHLELDRDVYYRSTAISEVTNYPYQNLRNMFCGWPGWGTQGWPILLRDGEDAKEYFMLGDNSPGSKDSRLWWEIGPHLQHLGENYQVGTVPDDQLIGQAFFVYWPSGYRRSWTADIGIIPNFGRMRWIR